MIGKEGYSVSPLRFRKQAFLCAWAFLKDETREKAEALLKKLHIQYRRSGTEAVLIAHKLNTAEHLRVIGKPAHLIVSLYEHPSINLRIQNASGKDYPGEDNTLAIFLSKESHHLILTSLALRMWTFLFLILHLEYFRYSRSS